MKVSAEEKKTVDWANIADLSLTTLVLFVLDLSVTSTILKKNPNCVETMKRLRKYVGNAKAWNMDDKEKLQFDFQAQQIRNKAEQIYSRFKVRSVR